MYRVYSKTWRISSRFFPGESLIGRPLVPLNFLIFNITYLANQNLDHDSDTSEKFTSELRGRRLKFPLANLAERSSRLFIYAEVKSFRSDFHGARSRATRRDFWDTLWRRTARSSAARLFRNRETETSSAIPRGQGRDDGNETNGGRQRAIFYLILFMSRVSNGIQFSPEKSVKRCFRKVEGLIHHPPDNKQRDISNFRRIHT